MGSLRGENTPRSLYLSGIGAIYVCAFVSFWLQYPGLLGARGLLPASDFWRKVAPEFGAASPTESFWKLLRPTLVIQHKAELKQGIAPKNALERRIEASLRRHNVWKSR